MQIKIDDMTLEGKWFGPKPPTAPSIVMLHEGLGSLSTWRDFPEQVAQATGAGVFVYSRAGYGRSMPPRSPQLDALHREAIEVLPRLLDKIGFQRGILLGHSDGGSIVTIYAGMMADARVRGLVLIEPHFDAEEKNLNGIRDMVEAYATTDLRERLARHHANVDAMFAAWSGRWLDPGFKSLDISRELASIRVPILILKSEDDPYSTMAQVHIAETVCHCPLQTVIIPGVGHLPHKTNPEKTLEAIANFANEIFSDRRQAGAPRT
jgi:pimeloyl-ACP methyl ester carboxylesterase